MGRSNDGALCNRKANKATGYCAHHGDKKVEFKKVCDEHKVHELDDPTQMGECVRTRVDERSDYEKQMAGIKEIIDSIQDLPSLREAQKKLMYFVVTGVIDSKAAPAINQMLKHQGELIKETKPKDEGLTNPERAQVIKRTKEMHLGEVWNLLQDFKGAFGMMTKLAKEQPQTVVDAEQVKVVEVSDESTRGNDQAVQRIEGPTARPESSSEVF